MDEAQPPPSISVLIVSYNCAPALRRCLEALERSEQRETIEILVVDNGSRDESGRLDVDFPRVTILRLPRNFGLTKARNIGTRTAKGEFLLLLEPDTEVQPETVPALAARLQSEPDAVAVCPLLVNPQGESVTEARPLPTPESLYRYWRLGRLDEASPLDLQAESIPVEFPARTAILVRTQFVKGMNYFDERYGQFGPDLELSYRIRTASKKILLLPGVRAISHCGDGLWSPADSSARAQLSVDQGLGIATYVSKHYGWASGLKVRLKMQLSALGGVLKMSNAGYHFDRLTLLLSGQKINGTQQGL
jgi:N-acetylglucosaminyl-diphospho-decaprenol L-rhamnosyltransferase